MFNKVAKFRTLPPRRPAPGVKAPANDNLRNARPCGMRRQSAPRLVCRWELSPSTGRPVCRWELDKADEPNPRLRDGSQQGRPFHKTVFQLSYQGEAAGTALRDAGRGSPAHAPIRNSLGRPNLHKVLHARHWTMRFSSLPEPASSHREWFAIGLVANDLQLRAMSCASIRHGS